MDFIKLNGDFAETKSAESLTDDEKNAGWKPLRNNIPVYDKTKQYPCFFDYEILETEVIANYTIWKNDKPKMPPPTLDERVTAVESDVDAVVSILAGVILI